MIPSLGQGACSALEGALELAQCLAAATLELPSSEAQHADDALALTPSARVLHAALRRYEAARLARAAAIQLRSATAGAAAYGGKAAHSNSNGAATASSSAAPLTAKPPPEAAASGAAAPRLAPGDPAALTDWLFRYESPHADTLNMAHATR